MKRILFSLSIFICAISSAQNFKYPFQYPKLPVEQRIENLLGLLTVDEKIGMMMDNSKAVPRLDIPGYGWWNEALHGVARAGTATVFPQAIGMAATWDVPEHLKTFEMISTKPEQNIINLLTNLKKPDVTKGLHSGRQTSISSVTRDGEEVRKLMVKIRI